MKANIGAALAFLAVSAVVLIFGELTLDMWDAERWGMMALSAFASLGTFAVLVSIVGKLTKGKHDDASD